MADEDVWTADDTYDEIDSDEPEVVTNAVRLVNVSRRYNIGVREIEALHDVSLEVKMDDFVAISGPSGSGKTTLLNLIGAIDYASEGRVFVMDVPIGDYDESFRATFRLVNTGFIFQSYNLVSTLTALENVMFPMQLSEKPLAEINADALKLLKKIGLDDRTDHLPWQLSSGEQQRVAIARAMANDPPIILADEPTANLDSVSAKMVRGLLRELHSQGKAVIVMTHDEHIIDTPRARHLKMADGELTTDV
ncbi:MAG: ABC transporter ATP-binding protein [Candidatus Thorarchaeota archaeon]